MKLMKLTMTRTINGEAVTEPIWFNPCDITYFYTARYNPDHRQYSRAVIFGGSGAQGVDETPEEVARLWAEAMDSPPLPPAGSLAEVAQRLVDALHGLIDKPVFARSVGMSEYDRIDGAVKAAAALGIVPGGAK